MIGAITGDIIGSIFEFMPTKRTDFQPLFWVTSTYTDDSILTCAVAKALMDDLDLTQTLKEFTRKYPNRGYGTQYLKWASGDDTMPYNSFGNGSAMRVSPVGFFCNSIDDVMEKAKWSAEVTHNHPEGIKGAQAVALAIYLARTGCSKSEIRQEISKRFDYDLDRNLKEIRPAYSFDVTCQGSVPEAIIAFLESDNYEDAIRKAISLGGDADTQACIAGGIAEAYYKEIPDAIIEQTMARLDGNLKNILIQFEKKYGVMDSMKHMT